MDTHKLFTKLVGTLFTVSMVVLGAGQNAALAARPAQGGTPNYFGPESNWANSPMPTVDPTTGAVSGGIRKFIDSLPGLGAAGANDLGQYIPVAVPDITTYPGSDYYEIELGEYTEQMHKDLNPTTLRGYRQTNTTDATVSKFSYLGPLIIAQKDRPVRIKFTNNLPTGQGGDLFLPVDTTMMGSGMGPHMIMASSVVAAGTTVTINTAMPHGLSVGTKLMLEMYDPPAFNGEYKVTAVLSPTSFQITLKADPGVVNPVMIGHIMEYYKDDRATLHLHGGLNPWISDGTQNQWITPANEQTAYPKGVSAVNVPDMAEPGPGSLTFYYSNQQGARLMFYHDHAFGITRLNVYAGEAAGYLLTDGVEQDLITRGILPGVGIPLIIQDKTFLDTTSVVDPVDGATKAKVLLNDPTWPFLVDATKNNLWLPHVYMPNQNPNDLQGVNAFGRWDYGPWFWPPWPVTNQPIVLPDGTVLPNVPDLSAPMESYMDTPMVNGTAYPYLDVQPQAYRFRILNASNDRMWNLQLYVADSSVVTADGRTNTEVKMVPAVQGAAAFPPEWTAQTTGQPGDILDGRTGGVPDPANIGPQMIQIGTEGGFLPATVVHTNVPMGYDRDPKSVTIGNVKEHNLWLGPAERADVIIDFSQFAGKTIILYNDSCAACPATDSRLDYYTGDLDATAIGGAPTTIPGFGPNTRTIMQFRVAANGTPVPYNKAALDAEFVSIGTTQGVFARGSDPIVVPQAVYNSAYGLSGIGTDTFPSGTTAYSRIQNTSLTFNPLDLTQATKLSPTPVTIPFGPKAIQELFNNTWGRMAAYLGVELPFTNGMNQTTIDYTVQDPVTEILNDAVTVSPVTSAGDGTQLWKITHNGVDTHPIHFHLFNVQVINRVGWDGSIRFPDPNELGWKDTVKMNPLEDIIVAMRPVAPKVPFGQPDSIRPLDPTMPIGSPVGFRNVDPATGNPITVTNQLYNFGWEYVWHCHILSHEEMDMMRPMQFNVARTLPQAPVLTAALQGTAVLLNWTDGTPVNDPATMGNPANEIGFRIERANVVNGVPGAYTPIWSELANVTSHTDSSIAIGPNYSYRVVAFNAAGDSPSTPAVVATVALPTAATGLNANVIGPHQVNLSWTDTSANETGFRIERAVGAGAFASVGTVLANVTTFSDTTAPDGSSLSYRVFAYNGAGDAVSPSNTVTVTTPLAPPSGLAGVVSATFPQTLTLNWTDNSVSETGYTIQRGTSASFTTILGTATVGANVTTYLANITVTQGATYYYRVQATQGAVTSAWVPVTVAVPYTIPVAPSLLSAAIASSTSVSLSWLDNSTNEASFAVWRTVNGAGLTQVGTVTRTAAQTAATGGTVTFTNTGLTAGNTYAYYVTAVNPAGASAQSNTVTVNFTVPAAPTNLTGSAVVQNRNNARVTLNWTDNANNETGFTIQRSGSSAFTNITTFTVGANVTTFQQNTNRGTTYYYRVLATNAVGASLPSNPVTVVTP